MVATLGRVSWSRTVEVFVGEGTPSPASTPGLPRAGAEGFREIDSNLRKSTAAARSMPSALTRRSNLSNSARASSRYASRKAAADVHAVPAMDGDIEVGRFESAGQMP